MMFPQPSAQNYSWYNQSLSNELPDVFIYSIDMDVLLDISELLGFLYQVAAKYNQI